MIRVMIALAWREVRLTVYRAAAIHSILSRASFKTPVLDGAGATVDYRLAPEQRAEIAADAEAMAWAMLDAERNAESGGEP